MKLFLKVVLTFIILAQISFGLQAQDTTNVNNRLPNNLPSTTGSMISNAINANSSALQQLGIDPIQAQTLANQALPGLQSGQIVVPGLNPNQNNGGVTIINNPNTSPDTVIIKGDTTILPRANMYGQDLFRSKILSTYNKSSDMQAPDDYILGEGDKVSVAVWGYSSYSATYTVDNSGAIYPTTVGKIYVKGLTFKQAKDLIKSRFGDVMDVNNSQMEVTLTYSRVISVNIVGEVFNPGTYSMNALNSVFNALAASNGPTDLGSLRKIYLKRDGQTIKTLDVYQFLLNPDSKQEFFLQNNDYIFVPPVGRVIQITGEVQRPFRYELIEGENLTSLLTYCGGLTSKAYTKSIQIKRYTNSQVQLINVNLDSLMTNKKDFVLMNGDAISINEVPDQVFNYVKVNGPVSVPGQYDFKTGDRISDVLAKCHGLREDAYTDRAYILRTNSDYTKTYIPFNPGAVISNPLSADNIQLQKLDEINVFSKTAFVDDQYVTINGAVHLPGVYTWGTNMTLKDLLLYSGGLKPEAANDRIEISRIVSTSNGMSINPEPVVFTTVQINPDLTIDKSSEGITIQPYDIVMVRTSSAFTKTGNIIVNGEVKFPGTYTKTTKTETLSSLINRSGGITQWAFARNATLIRKNDNRGFVFMRLDKALKHPGSKWDLILEEGDVLNVPVMTDIVTISGYINFPYADSLSQINVPFAGNCHRAKYYIKKYGQGFAKEGHKSQTYVIQPGNNVTNVQRLGFIRIYPKVPTGSYIVVPLEKVNIKQKLNDKGAINWDSIIESALTKITAVLSLYVLANKIL